MAGVFLTHSEHLPKNFRQKSMIGQGWAVLSLFQMPFAPKNPPAPAPISIEKKGPTVKPPGGMRVHSVSGLNELVRGRLQSDPDLRSIWLEGEVSNLAMHSSGHIYFSLKDDSSQLRCTFFRRQNAYYQHLPLKDGAQLLVFGSISVYLKRGEYQFNVQRVMLAGEGELRLRIEELKKRLSQEGLFDRNRKKPLPYLPTTLGIATASTGAAVRDILYIALTRYPNLNIILAPCQVQGERAPLSIIKALDLLQMPQFEVDVIITGRGGGSFEDLLAFNDEAVVRAIAACRLPIVSAVGHEIDTSLSDLAADEYASTPTAAAEKVVPRLADLMRFIEECQVRWKVALQGHCSEERRRLEQMLQAQVYQEPLSILQEHWQNLDRLQKNLHQNTRITYQQAWRHYERFAYLPVLFYEKNIAAHRQRYELLWERLHNFSPLATLKRGYAVVRGRNRKIIRSHRDVSPKEELEILLARGALLAEVKEIKRDQN